MKIEKLIRHRFDNGHILVIAELVKVNGKLRWACKNHADIYQETDRDFRKRHAELKIIGKRKNLCIDVYQAYYRFKESDLQ